MSMEGRRNKREQAPPAAPVVSPSTPVETTPPVVPAQKGEKIKVVLVNTDEIREDNVRDAAERKLTASKEDMRGFKGFFGKMWKHGMAREYYRQKEISRTRAAMNEHGSIYAGEGDQAIEQRAHEDAMRAIVDRFASEYKETVHAGESRTTLDKKGTEGERKIHEDISTLIKEYAAGTLTDANFKEARTRLLQEVSESQEGARKNSSYADNLLEVARQVKLAVDHGTKLEDLDLELDIKLGTAKSAIRTEANYNAADRVIEAIKKTPVGRLVNEGTLATGVAVAYSVGVWAGRSALSSNVAKILTFGGSAAVAIGLTGFAENKRIKEDRRQHAREMAQGRSYEEGKSPRREEMDKYIYQMEGAGALTSGLRTLMYDESELGNPTVRTLSAEDRASLVSKLADIEARLSLNETQSIDLVSYSAPTAIERERLDLDLMRAKTRADLEKVFTKTPDASGKSLAELIEIARTTRINDLTKGEEGIEARNKRFNAMKGRRVAKAAAIGAISGLAVGAVVQETGAFFDSYQVGAVERLVRGDAVFNEGGRHLGATPAESLRALIEHRLPVDHGPLHQVILRDDGRVRLPEGMTITHSDHGYQLSENGRVLADGLSLTSDGGLDQESIAQLEHRGLIVSASTEQITHTVNANVAPRDYLTQHPNLGQQHVSRDLWFDNDTPAPTFDRNELRLWWGGDHNQGLDANGQYTFSMEHMVRGGSFHSGLNADAQRLMVEGKLRILLSVSQDTQATPIEIPIGPDGSIHIDPDSETGRLLFRTDANGHAQFLGRFAEVAEVTGAGQDGTEHVRILATYEGQGVETVPSTTTTTVPRTTTIINAPHDYRIDPPPVIPPWGRTPLEPVVATRPAAVGRDGAGKAPEATAALAEVAESEGYDSSSESTKQYKTALSVYRSSPEQLANLANRIKSSPELASRYGHVLAERDMLLNPTKSVAQIRKFSEAAAAFNKRYKPAEPLTPKQYVARQLDRLNRQLENIAIEEAKVGEKPFAESFYKESPFIQGIERAEQIVVYLDDPIGDAVVMVPIVDALDRYRTLNGITKDIVVVTKHKALLSSLEAQYGVRVMTPAESGEVLEKEEKERFIINTHKSFEDYRGMGIESEDMADPSHILSGEWSTWEAEEYPDRKGHRVRYYSIPARIARNFEVMLGQRLYNDINATDHYIDTNENFEIESRGLRRKYRIAPNAPVFVISAGSSVMPKEYQPEKWAEVMKGIMKENPKAHILLLDDPDPERRERYGKMADAARKAGVRVTRISEPMEKMNTIMSMAEYVITPDTGLGHYAGALGRKNIMLILGDPAWWSTPGTIRVTHPKATETYRKGSGTYNPAWSAEGKANYFVRDGDVMVGASDIEPKKILDRIEVGKKRITRASNSPGTAGTKQKIRVVAPTNGEQLEQQRRGQRRFAPGN